MASTPRPIIAILTDFGLRDHYVAAMKGVALSICPEATFIDITHEIPPQAVADAAWQLEMCVRYLPEHTVFVVVVDPGVGTARRAIAVQWGTQRFVGPDNGVLTAVLDEQTASVVEITAPAYQRPVVSRTFEGRDRFAPAGAWLAAGLPLARLGPPVTDANRLTRPQPEVRGGEVHGVVMVTDRFGNAITNIPGALVDARAGTGAAAVVAVGGHQCRLVHTYAELGAGQVGALVGSTGRLEIAVAHGSAAERLGITAGMPVVLAAAVTGQSC